MPAGTVAQSSVTASVLAFKSLSSFQKLLKDSGPSTWPHLSHAKLSLVYIHPMLSNTHKLQRHHCLSAVYIWTEPAKGSGTVPLAPLHAPWPQGSSSTASGRRAQLACACVKLLHTSASIAVQFSLRLRGLSASVSRHLQPRDRQDSDSSAELVWISTQCEFAAPATTCPSEYPGRSYLACRCWDDIFWSRTGLWAQP